MKHQTLFVLCACLLLFSACNKKQITELKKELELKEQEVIQLEQQVGYLQKTNGSLLDRMADLSIVSKAGAESIQHSLKSLSQQYDYIQNLNTKIQSKDSLNLALVLNLKRSLTDINDEDVQVEVRGGKVHVSISDKLLFKSGSSTISSRANDVLGKIAEVISDHDELDIMVEGHTDDVPMSNSCVTDNWDLSVKRATSVVRVLTDEYYVSPQRLTAAGRSEYLPKAENDTAEGRSINRRTEIVIMPQLDQFFKLLEAPEVKQ
ncbi:MAG: OmpA family protein [Bacteroidota bacterium]